MTEGDGLTLYLHGGTTGIKDSIINNYPYMETENLCFVIDGNYIPEGENYIYGGECQGFTPQDSNLLDTYSSGFHYDLGLNSPNSRWRIQLPGSKRRSCRF